MSELMLYYSPGACSLAAHIALREWGVPFELRRVVIAQGDLAKPEFLVVNPRARVPVLLVDGQPVTELSGILTWIGQQCGLYPPPGGQAAARCGEWLAWLTSCVHISFALLWRGRRFLTDERLFSLLRSRGYAWLREQFGEIEAALAVGPFALGDTFTVVDCNLIPFYRWGVRVGFNMAQDYPCWSAHTARQMTRTAVSAAIAEEGIDFEPIDPALIPTRPNASAEALAAFGAAWEKGDVDSLMNLFAPACFYVASVGPEPGETFAGRKHVRDAICKMLAHDGNRARRLGETWLLGDEAFAEWSYEEQAPDGAKVIRGIDHFVFSSEGVIRKDAYRKTTE